MSGLADELRAEVDRAAARLRGLSAEEVAREREAGRWVRQEILGHLIDSAANNHQRFVRAQAVDPLVWPGYDQVAWVEAQGYRRAPWAELVDLWVALNRHLARVIEAMPPERLATSCVIGARNPAPLEWWMRDYLRHLRHHLAQLLET